MPSGMLKQDREVTELSLLQDAVEWNKLLETLTLSVCKSILEYLGQNK